MNKLNREKQELILTLLVEGNSMRSISRIVGVHRNTITKLMFDVAEKCREDMQERLTGLHCDNVECDEIWTFVGKKQRRLNGNDNHQELGDQYVFIAIDGDSKLVPTFTVGKRTQETAWEFIRDLDKRVDGEFQLTTDQFNGYFKPIKWTLGSRVHYGTLHKTYYSNGHYERSSYSPSRLKATIKEISFGLPKLRNICTSYVERNNLTIRMQLRRFTRLTNAFSKKLDHLIAMLTVYFWHYNFVRKHGTLGTTPAVAAGVAADYSCWGDVLD